MVATETERTAVGLGEIAVARDPHRVLIAYGLGSCVGVCIYDPVCRVGGMAHVVLPCSNEANREPSAKYADIAVPQLVRRLLQLGAVRGRMLARIAGGAQMLNIWGMSDRFSIGERNVGAVRLALSKEIISLMAADTGGNSGRTVTLDIATGRVCVRVAGLSEKEL